MEQPPGYRKPVVAGPESFGAGLGQAISRAGEVAGEMALKQQEQDDVKAVLDASEAYKKDMITAFNGENGFYSLKGDNASNVAQQSADFMTKTREKYEGTLNARQLQSFRNHVLATENSYYQGALTHQQQEKDAAFTNTVNSGIETDTQMIMANYKNTELMNTPLADIDKKVAAFGAVKGWDNETIKTQQDKYRSKAISDAFEYAVNMNDLDRAQGIIKDFGGIVDKTVLGKMENTIRPILQQDELFRFADALKKDPNMLNPDGTLNIEKAQAATEARYGVNATKKVTTKGKGVADTTLINEWVSGATQNVDPVFLTRLAKLAKDKGQKIDIQDGFRTFDEQNALYEASDKSGTMVAAPGRSRHEVSLAIDAGSDWVKQLSTDELEKYGLHKPMDYEDWHIEPTETKGKGTLALKAVSLGGEETTVSAYDPVMYKKAIEAVHSAAAELNAVHNQQVKQKMDAFDNYMLANKPSTIAEIEQAARDFGLTGSDLLGAIGAGKQVAGLVKFEENQASEEAYEQAKKDIYEGRISSQAALKAKYGDSVKIDHLITLGNFLDATYNKSLHKPPELQNQENWNSFQGVLKGAGIKDKIEEGKILEKVTIRIKEARDKGEQISRYDIEEMTREYTAKTILVNKPWAFDKKGILADVPSAPGWGVDNESVYYQDPGTGQIIRPDKYENGKYYKTVNGVDVEMVP
jgi:hypothetical protein